MHHKNDGDFQGYRILSKWFFQSWKEKIIHELISINSNQNISKHVIITFISRL